MSLPAQRAEAEFDNLLGQLTDELAMTPMSEPSVALVPDAVEAPAARVESTRLMAADAAASAGAMAQAQARPDNTMVKVVGILAASLTVVGVAAVLVFGGREPAPATEAPAVAIQQDEGAAERDQVLMAQRQAAQQAAEQAQAIARAEQAAAHARYEATRLQAELQAQAEAKTSKKKRRKRTRKRNKQSKSLATDFDAL